MITVKHVDFCQENRHLTLINGKVSPRLNNQFAMIENGLDAGDAYLSFFIWLQDEIQKPYSTIKRDLIKLAKAHKRGQWIEIACFDEYNHADLIAQAIDELSETLKDIPKAKIATRHGSTVEPIIGFHDDEEFEYIPDWDAEDGELETRQKMLQPVEQPKFVEYDMPLNQIVWVIGQTAAMLGFMVDDNHALVPNFGFVKANSFRFAKHKIGKLDHVQSALSEEYNTYYELEDDADWICQSEFIESELTDEGSRYETDLDPYNGHFDDDITEPGFWLDLCVEDANTHNVKDYAQKKYGGLVSYDQIEHVQPIYISRDNKIYAVREVSDQLRNKFIRRPADRIHTQEYQCSFA